MSRQKSSKEPSEGAVIEIDVAEIVVPERLMRTSLNDESFAELKTSIADCGLINPISVRKTDDGYLLIAGYRRYKAHIELRRSTIRASVYAGKAVKTNAITLHENLIREAVNIADEADWVKEYMDEDKLSKSEIARRLNRSEAWVRERLIIAEWPEVLKEALRLDKLPLRVLREFAKCDDLDQVQMWVQYGSEYGVSLSTAHNWLVDWQMSSTLPPKDEEIRDMERAITDYTQPVYICEICSQERQPGELKFIRVCRSCLQIGRAAMEQLDNE